MMNEEFHVANLSDETLDKIKDLERDLMKDKDDSIILIAYEKDQV
ncbi:hypothetical protein [Pseudalkalibacillus berkeleyi]|nr:hypothetical protein [Pseudalkalibacillus berkeleyi]